MTNFWRRGLPRQFGRKTPVAEGMLAGSKPLTYNDFSGGLRLDNVRQDIEPNFSPNAMDVEVSPTDTLRRAPGVSVVEVLSDMDVRQMVAHASLDYSAELVLFAAPFLGVKKHAGTEWYDLGLDSGARYATVNFGGTLVFSNRRLNRVYARQFGSTTVETLEGAVAGLTYASFAGRIFTANAVLDGNIERMGIAWSAANSAYDDWQGLGAGFELLIDDMSAGDKIMALRTMGLDFMAIVCRNSVWVGRRTGLRDRPADFQPRVPKIGTVSEATVTTSRYGVIFLHDSGVYLFDGNDVQHLSEAIDSELLGLDYSRLDEYSAQYHPVRHWYYLFTPGGTWVLDIRKRRWFRLSLVAHGAALFAPQFETIVWDEAQGTWDEQTLTWDEFSPEQGERYRMHFLGEGDEGSILGVEEDRHSCYFGIPQTPWWEFPLVQQQPPDRLLTATGLVLEYEGDGLIGLRYPNGDGDYRGIGVFDLPEAAEPRVVSLPHMHTGLGAGLRLDFGSGCVEVRRLDLLVQLRGPRIGNAITREAGYEDYDNLSTL